MTQIYTATVRRQGRLGWQVPPPPPLPWPRMFAAPKPSIFSYFIAAQDPVPLLETGERGGCNASPQQQLLEGYSALQFFALNDPPCCSLSLPLLRSRER